ncbi:MULTISPECIES: SMI1/KNR4 family protein [unclassified Streptomyces]|uniref:SMI1/KNR4 family protein n=1 Tax=unclassified Streptomyces TaxID=2593676 RepID=UPI002E28F7A7|nr:SMI1/KNR4 family protein [Streptomyces sp. NBC_00223]
MKPDLVLLRDLIDSSPVIGTRPDRGCPEADIRRAESVVGPLPASYRWWLAHYGEGTVHGEALATVVPPRHAGAVGDLTGLRAGNRLGFHDDGDCDDSYHFALDEREDEECPVVRWDCFTGGEERFADSFAGFLTARVALASGLGNGPNPTIARLWRSTPGVLRPDGVHVYGPHTFVERDRTYRVRALAPHWVLIGDDGGGRGLFMRRHGRDRTSVYRLDFRAVDGDIEDSGGERVTGDLLAWLLAGTDGRRS